MSNSSFVPALRQTPVSPGNELFPVFFRLEQLRVLVIGGGATGLEKLNALFSNCPAAEVKLVAMTVSPEIQALKTLYPNFSIEIKEYQEADLDKADIVIVAAGNHELSRIVYEEASARNLLVNVADTPALCDFYLGSVVRKGDLKIAISTNGKSPTLAKRLREVFSEALPDETQIGIEQLNKLRAHLKGDFSNKVKEMNKLTSVLLKKKEEKSYVKRSVHISLYVIAIIALMLAGHLLFTIIPLQTIGGWMSALASELDRSVLIYMLGGFVAQMIDGALGMAYGVSVTTFLMGLGIPMITPAVASASMHAAEVFTTGTSSLVYMRYKNVNNKLFKILLIPGAIGAICGAFVISFVSKDSFTFVKPLVAIYTLVLGILIIRKALSLHLKTRKKIRRFGPVALAGGFLDSVGGGGWGPIVTTTLVAAGRDFRYAVGSSHVAKFFVALISTATFFAVIGMSHWKIIFGLVVGSMIAAPISISLSRRISKKWGLIIVGMMVIIISMRTIIFALIS